MQQLSGLDAAFLYIEAYREREHLARCFCQRILQVPLGLDHPYWINDAHYDPEFHIRHIALPKPGDWRQLCIQAARLHARPLDRNHPLWEAYVIGGLDNVEGVPPGAFAIFSKIHHAAIDGMSGNEILGAMHDLASVPETPREAPQWRADRHVTGLRLVGKAAANRLKQPYRLSALAARTAPSLARAF